MLRGNMSTYSPCLFYNPIHLNPATTSLHPQSADDTSWNLARGYQTTNNTYAWHYQSTSYIYELFIPKTKKYFLLWILFQFVYSNITHTLRSGSNTLCSKQVTFCVSVVSRKPCLLVLSVHLYSTPQQLHRSHHSTVCLPQFNSTIWQKVL